MIRLGSVDVGAAGSLAVIAEAGVNHDGDLSVAHRLVDVAASAGADAVKFQTFEPSALVSPTARTAPYQSGGDPSASERTQSELLAALTLPATAWAELRDHAHEAGIAFLSTPFDLASAVLLAELGVPALKLSSGELTNLPLLRAVAALGVPVILSTGMGDDAEVDAAVAALAAAPELVLMHCVSAYPAPIGEANLRSIPALAARHGCPVGWSDHTVGPVTALGAVALGAAVLEKHLTLDRGRPGPDHAASADPEQFAEYVALARSLATALGDGVKRRTASEAENAAVVRRSWHAARPLAAGSVIGADDVVALRPETGLTPGVSLLGRVLAVDVPRGEPVTDRHLQPIRDGGGA